MIFTHHGYTSGHPWYYVLGGVILPPKMLRAEALNADYRGYLSQRIDDADRLAEPKRSATLAALRANVLQELREDLHQYRACVRNLTAYRANHGDTPPKSCEGVHVTISLKATHLSNGFANLRRLEACHTQLALF